MPSQKLAMMVTETLMTLDTDALTALLTTDALLVLMVPLLEAEKVQNELNRRTSASTPRSWRPPRSSTRSRVCPRPFTIERGHGRRGEASGLQYAVMPAAVPQRVTPLHSCRNLKRP